MQIFENLAKSFVDFDITGENRSFVKELIIEYNKSRLLYYKELTPTKQTLDELADTLTNHALLDRTGNKDFITLSMNLFLGICSENQFRKNLSHFAKLNPIPEHLIELAIYAYKYSSNDDKLKLWDKFSVIKDKMSLYLAVTTDCILLKKVTGNYKCAGLNSFHLKILISLVKNVSL